VKSTDVSDINSVAGTGRKTLVKIMRAECGKQSKVLFSAMTLSLSVHYVRSLHTTVGYVMEANNMCNNLELPNFVLA